jgi:hypothetical protein
MSSDEVFAVQCATNTYAVGGTVAGLRGSGLVLQDNLGDNLPVRADGSFAFATTEAAEGGSNPALAIELTIELALALALESSNFEHFYAAIILVILSPPPPKHRPSTASRHESPPASPPPRPMPADCGADERGRDLRLQMEEHRSSAEPWRAGTDP